MQWIRRSRAPKHYTCNGLSVFVRALREPKQFIHHKQKCGKWTFGRLRVSSLRTQTAHLPQTEMLQISQWTREIFFACRACLACCPAWPVCPARSACSACLACSAYPVCPSWKGLSALPEACLPCLYPLPWLACNDCSDCSACPARPARPACLACTC